MKFRTKFQIIKSFRTEPKALEYCKRVQTAFKHKNLFVRPIIPKKEGGNRYQVVWIKRKGGKMGVKS